MGRRAVAAVQVRPRERSMTHFKAHGTSQPHSRVSECGRGDQGMPSIEKLSYGDAEDHLQGTD